MLSVHLEKVNSDKKKCVENELWQSGRECSRRLQFVFDQKVYCINKMYSNNI